MASELLGSKHSRRLARVVQTQPWRLVTLISSPKWLEAKKLSLRVLTFTTVHELALQLGNQLLWLIRMQK